VSLSAIVPPPAHAQKLVCFSLGEQVYGAPIEAVKETLPRRPVTRLHLVPDFIAGLINLRGEVVAVINLERLLGLPGSASAEEGDDGAIVILRAEGARRHGKAAAGLLVDRLLGVCDLQPEAVGPLPPTIAGEPAAYLVGVATVGEPRRPLLVLDPARVLTSERLRPYRRS
jgi:purine-binding chemotaxis protein CheW